jgi:hypothetical protein
MKAGKSARPLSSCPASKGRLGCYYFVFPSLSFSLFVSMCDEMYPA